MPARPVTSSWRKAWLIAIVACLSLASCAVVGSRFGTPLVSEDGGVEIRVPDSWSKRSDLNPAAALQAGNREDELYVVVVVDPREFFAELSLGQFADTEIQRFVDTVAEPELLGPQLVIVDDSEALQYEVRGVVDEQNVVYLYTFAETSDRFLKIVSWTLSSRYDEHANTMQRVIESVRQLEPLGDVRPSPRDGSGTPVQPTPLPSIDRGDRN